MAFDFENNRTKTGKFFPMYVDLNGKKAVVFGGGTIASRRVETLMQFCGDITVIAPQISESILKLKRNGYISAVCRKYIEGDCVGADLVIAATNNRKVNHSIYLECRKNGISVNTADRKDECSFYFPAVITCDNVVIGVTASGTDHKLAKKTADNIRNLKDKIF